MNRRLTVALAATAALGLGAATTAGAAAKNEIRIVGGVVVEPGKFVKDNQRFKPRDKTVKSGATVKLVNRARTRDPHTISFIKKRFLPEKFGSAAMGPLGAAHQIPEGEGEPGVLIIDDGQPLAEGATLEVDKMGDDKTAGDSAFIAPGQKSFSFKVTADEGSKLFYFCAIHPWMQGKITVD
jgi:plastocyanin